MTIRHGKQGNAVLFQGDKKVMAKLLDKKYQFCNDELFMAEVLSPQNDGYIKQCVTEACLDL